MAKSIGFATTAPGGALKLPAPAGASGTVPQGNTARQQLARASLIVYELQPAANGTNAKVGAKVDEIEFQFNPKEVTIQKSAKWERKPATGAKKAGPPQFTGSEPAKLTLEMFFDATGTHDASVVATVERLLQCCVPTEASAGKNKPTPPLVALHWGQVTSFAAFVTSVSAKYTLFSSEGIPIRALCSVALEEMPVEPWKQNPTSGALAVRRAHSMVEGDSLASVAFAEYGDPTMWRPLAAFNGIDDPLRVPPGTQLLLPSAAELAGEQGPVSRRTQLRAVSDVDQ